MRKFQWLIFLLFFFRVSHAQILINSTGSAYTQNFNSLLQTGSSNAWTDNSTIAGWYSTLSNYAASSGTGTGGGLYSYGASAAPGDVTDRALGLLSTGSTFFRFAAQLKNTTGATVTSFSVSYTGEQWRQTANAQKLVFEYSTDATSITTGTWTAVTTLDFTALQATATGALDGNAGANRTAITGTVVASVPDQGIIWFRWTKSGTTSPGLAIDDLSITANTGVVNSITTGSVLAPPFCVDASNTASATVDYTATGTYNTTFTAYLSDASGSFAAPVAVGSAAVNGTDPSGTINIVVPAGTANGTGYKVRVQSSSPAVTGSTSTAFEIVNGAKNSSAASAVAGNTTINVNWTNPNACFDEVMVVAKASVSVAASPSGNGSAYTASTVFGNGTAFDGGYVVYKGTTSPQTFTNLANGTLYYFKIFTRKGSNWSSGVELTSTPDAQIGGIVINQLSPDYGAATDEYIELLNKTNASIDLSGFAIKYQSASGSSGGAGGTLSGVLPPRSYWLLSPNATVTVGQTNNLSRDGAISSGMAASGQIALVRLSDNTIIDAVGYGTITGGTYTETTAAPAPPSNGGIKRNPDGTDTNNNSTDFITVPNANLLLRNGAAAAPLPIKLIDLRAVQKGAVIEVSWSNATEFNVKDYTVERSLNSTDFSSIMRIYPTSNLQSRADYLVTDDSPLQGIAYYRIRCTEADGKTTYSNILRLNTSPGKSSLMVYPNPVKDNTAAIQLNNIPAGRYTVRVVGAEGQVVHSALMMFDKGSSTQTFSTSNLPSGIYVLQITGQVNLQKIFLKQ